MTVITKLQIIIIIIINNNNNNKKKKKKKKKERQWLIFEGTVCNIGQIQERDKLKTEKDADLSASLKRLYPGYNVVQVNLVFDFLSGYHKEPIHKLNNIGLSDSMNVIRKCQKWVNRREL